VVFAQATRSRPDKYVLSLKRALLARAKPKQREIESSASSRLG